jgi:hypothetical protein
MATGNVILDDPRPVEVLHDGQWVPGRLLAYRRDRDGWRGMVRYRVDLSQYLHVARPVGAAACGAAGVRRCRRSTRRDRG